MLMNQSLTPLQRRLLCAGLLLCTAVIVSAQSLDLDAYRNASEEAPYDMTFLIENADGTGSSGWSRNASDAAADYNTHNPEFDSDVYSGVCVESWYWSPLTSTWLIWQDVSGILPGTYRISAYVVGRIYNDSSHAGECGEGLYLDANGERAAITSPTFQRLSVTCTIASGETLTLGIYADEDNTNDWTGIAGVTLECLAPGDAQDIFLSEQFDVLCVRDQCYANVLLRRHIPTDSYTTLCLPFDVSAAQADSLFADVLLISGASLTDDGNIVVTTTAAEEGITTGQCYLVKGLEGMGPVYTFPAVLVTPTAPDATTLATGISAQGDYRLRWSQEGVYVLSDGLSTFTPVASPQDLKGYGVYLTTDE